MAVLALLSGLSVVAFAVSAPQQVSCTSFELLLISSLDFAWNLKGTWSVCRHLSSSAFIELENLVLDQPFQVSLVTDNPVEVFGGRKQLRIARFNRYFNFALKIQLEFCIKVADFLIKSL